MEIKKKQNDGFQHTLALIVYYDVDYYIIVFVRVIIM